MCVLIMLDLYTRRIPVNNIHEMALLNSGEKRGTYAAQLLVLRINAASTLAIVFRARITIFSRGSCLVWMQFLYRCRS